MNDPRPTWRETEHVPPLQRGEVHVWHVHLSPAAPQSAALLCEDERQRAQRYHFARDRDRFVACRAKLRQLLGQYVGQSPERLTFAYGPHGKPSLAQGVADEALCFNVSHSGDAALLAFARGMQVGVDMECVTTPLDYQALADRFMSPREAAYIRDAADIARAFYTCWTRKEAWMKATGCGLSDAMARFDVSPSLHQTAATVRCDEGLGLDWTVYELSPGTNLVGAVAVEGLPVRIARLLS